MDDKERQRQEFKNRNERNRKYLKKSKWCVRISLALFLGMIGWVIVYSSYSKPWVLYTLLVWVILFIIASISLVFILRCPHCDSILMIHSMGDRCPICGTKIEEYSDL